MTSLGDTHVRKSVQLHDSHGSWVNAVVVDYIFSHSTIAISETLYTPWFFNGIAFVRPC